MLEGRFQVFEDNLETTLLSMESGIRQLQDTKMRRSRKTQQTMYTQRVSPSGDDAHGSNNIVEVWTCS